MSEQEGSERSVSLSQPLSSFHQGGEGLATRGHVLEDEPSLASSLASLVTKQKLGAPSPLQGLWKQQMTDLFSKRKRRWRKRHGREGNHSSQEINLAMI